MRQRRLQTIRSTQGTEDEGQAAWLMQNYGGSGSHSLLPLHITRGLVLLSADQIQQLPKFRAIS